MTSDNDSDVIIISSKAAGKRPRSQSTQQSPGKGQKKKFKSAEFVGDEEDEMDLDEGEEELDEIEDDVNPSPGSSSD